MLTEHTGVTAQSWEAHAVDSDTRKGMHACAKQAQLQAARSQELGIEPT
jgi:hypothetical protein